MARIATIIADMFEDVEFTEPVKALKDAGHAIVTVGLEAGTTVRGKSQDTPVMVEKEVGEVAAGDFDALLIPGGFSPDILRGHEAAVRLAAEFVRSGKPVFAICHGPQLLISGRVLEGRAATGWKSIRQDLIYAGAKFEDREVVRDGNLITSRQPDDIPAFNRAMLEALEGK